MNPTIEHLHFSNIGIMSKFVGEQVSKCYGMFRPRLNDAVVKRVLGYLTQKIPLNQCSTVIDVGCGTGLGTIPFAQALPSNVLIDGLDSSQTQIEEAQKSNNFKNVNYRVHDISTGFPFPDNHVDMITAVQAAHWFDMNTFFPECKRVLKPSGVIAFISYALPQIEVPGATHEVNEKLCGLIAKLNDDLDEGGFWHPSMRPRLMSQYRVFQLPFGDQACYRDDESLYTRNETTLEMYLNFLETWSGVRTYRTKQPDGPIVKGFYDKYAEIQYCHSNFSMVHRYVQKAIINYKYT